jgi:hypothetical protein
MSHLLKHRGKKVVMFLLIFEDFFKQERLVPRLHGYWAARATLSRLELLLNHFPEEFQGLFLVAVQKDQFHPLVLLFGKADDVLCHEIHPLSIKQQKFFSRLIDLVD